MVELGTYITFRGSSEGGEISLKTQGSGNSGILWDSIWIHNERERYYNMAVVNLSLYGWSNPRDCNDNLKDIVVN